MATSKGSNTYNRLNWEDAEFPVLCQTCLGDNPYIRMTKEKFGKECKICSRPFTVFRWCPGARMRFKKTEVCQTCSRQKNVCQTCLLDLEYGLPVQVRDQALTIKDDIPRSEVNKEYYSQNLESQIMNLDSTEPYGQLGKAPTSGELLMKLARTTPYYKRNRPHICSFWVKGECKRGEECPYRHEKPTDPDDPLADQNIKDRFYGLNDPVADKLLKRAAAMPKLEAPEDRSITTLYVGNLDEIVEEKDLRDYFYQFGEIRSITMLARQQCAFIQFTTRNSAEAAAEKSFNKVIMAGRRLTIKWGRSQAKTSVVISKEGEIKSLEPVPGLPGALPMPPEELRNNYFNLPSTSFPPPPHHLASGMMGFPPPPPPGRLIQRFPFPTHFMGIPPPGLLSTGSPIGPPPPQLQASPAATGVASENSNTNKDPGNKQDNSSTGETSGNRVVPIHYPSQDPQRMGSHGSRPS